MRMYGVLVCESENDYKADGLDDGAIDIDRCDWYDSYGAAHTAAWNAVVENGAFHAIIIEAEQEV